MLDLCVVSWTPQAYRDFRQTPLGRRILRRLAQAGS
jgi:hypothetical protein